jgi:hypothetical protein
MKSKEANLENRLAQMTGFGARVCQYLPIIFFAIAWLGAWLVRAFAVEQVSSLANVFMVFLTSVATLVVLNQRLPLQNVIALIIVIALFSGVTMLAAVALKISILPPVVNEKFRHLPTWTAPLLWTIGLVNARGIAKLFLHRLRKSSNYGIAIIALSSLLVASLNLRAETGGRTFVIQIALACAALVATTPWFIDKKRIEQKPDIQPLIITALLLFW